MVHASHSRASALRDVCDTPVWSGLWALAKVSKQMQIRRMHARAGGGAVGGGPRSRAHAGGGGRHQPARRRVQPLQPHPLPRGERAWGWWIVWVWKASTCTGGGWVHTHSLALFPGVSARARDGRGVTAGREQPFAACSPILFPGVSARGGLPAAFPPLSALEARLLPQAAAALYTP